MATFFPKGVRRGKKGRIQVGVHGGAATVEWREMPSRGTIVRPPPGGLQCEVCRRKPGDVAPYGGAGDPLESDWSGAHLVKNARLKGLLGSSWECRECVLLSEEGYERALRMR